MGKIGRKIRKGFKSVARAMGGPITGAVDAVKASKDGKGAKGAARAFGRSLRPGQGVEAMHDAHVDVAEEVIRQTAGESAASRVRTFGRITRPNTVVSEPIKTVEALGSTIKAVAAGDWKRAGRSVAGEIGNTVMRPAEDILNKGGAVGDLFDEPSQRLDDRLYLYLRRIFGSSIDFDEVEINPGRPGPGTDTGGLALPRVIYLGGNSQASMNLGVEEFVTLVPEGSVLKPNPLLVHELVHFWQFKHGGGRYLTDALMAYALHSQEGSYLWWNFTDRNRTARIDGFDAVHGATFQDMPVEAQASFIQEAVSQGAFESGDYPWMGGLRLRSTDLTRTVHQTAYASAFGATAEVDWSTFLAGAVEALHEGDFQQ